LPVKGCMDRVHIWEHIWHVNNAKAHEIQVMMCLCRQGGSQVTMC
jgi:hypothetical protein